MTKRRNRKIDLSVTESEQQLKHAMKRENSLLAKQRVKALLLVKQGKAMSVTHLSEQVKASWPTVRDWLETYRAGGLEALLALGRTHQKHAKPCGLSEAAGRAVVDRAHEPGGGFTSYADAWRWTVAEHGTALGYKRFRELARARLGLRLKAPRPVNRGQDPAAVAEFKKNSRAGGRPG